MGMKFFVQVQAQAQAIKFYPIILRSSFIFFLFPHFQSRKHPTDIKDHGWMTHAQCIPPGNSTSER